MTGANDAHQNCWDQVERGRGLNEDRDVWDGRGMRSARGRVSGRIVILEEDLPDGAEVEVRVRQGEDVEEGVEVTDAEWAALMEAAESVRQGKTVDKQTVLAALSRRR